MAVATIKTRKKTYLNVVGRALRANRKALQLDPAAPLETPLTARTAKGGRPAYGHRVHILDAAGNRVACLVYDPARPLGCGAVAYVVCEHGVEVDPTPPATTKEPKTCRT